MLVSLAVWVLEETGLQLDLGVGSACRVLGSGVFDVLFHFLLLVALPAWHLRGSTHLAKALSFWTTWLVQAQSSLSWTVHTATGGSMTAHMPRMWGSDAPLKPTRSLKALLVPCSASSSGGCGEWLTVPSLLEIKAGARGLLACGLLHGGGCLWGRDSSGLPAMIMYLL